ncbi:hypothetical protein EVB96_372 [Rhizobium phage RHph_TM3_3_6]|nr:hypothetical protein EVB96_372 [Rhizobium phage RHph_TM3_3_6]
MSDPIQMFKSSEKLSRIYYQAHFPMLIAIQGIDCEISRKIPRLEDDVYGTHAGTSDVDVLSTTKILMSTSQWRIATSYEGGWFDDIGYMYCMYDIIDGDLVSLTREDGEEITFQVLGTEILGITTKILKRFKLTNLGESD